MSRVKKKMPRDILPLHGCEPVLDQQTRVAARSESALPGTAIPVAEASQLTPRKARLRPLVVPNDNVPGRTLKGRAAASKGDGQRKRLTLRSPADIAGRLCARNRNTTGVLARSSEMYIRETFQLSRKKAHAKAQEWFRIYPRDSYSTEIEFWRACDELARKGRISGGYEIELTMRRLRIAG